jgi:hypothetical protein
VALAGAIVATSYLLVRSLLRRCRDEAPPAEDQALHRALDAWTDET